MPIKVIERNLEGFVVLVVSDSEQKYWVTCQSRLQIIVPNRDTSCSTFAMMTGRAEPLSIESLLQKQKQEKEAASKVCFGYIQQLISIHWTRLLQPKFLSKEERAKIAIAKRAAELKEQREREEKAKQDRETLEREAGDIRQRDRERERATRYGGGAANTSRRKLSSFVAHRSTLIVPCRRRQGEIWSSRERQSLWQARGER
jgi:hypothetical protein